MSDDALKQLLARPALLLNGISKELSERSLLGFIKEGWAVLEPGRTFLSGWAIEAICEHLEAVTDGEITRLIINVPPGSAKSTIVSVMWNAWEWGPLDNPELRYISTSYRQDYAIRDSRKSRDLMMSDWYKRNWGDRFSFTRSGDGSFGNNHMGWREALPYASLTSGRADRLLIDDPHSTESALSDTDRKTAERIFLESVPTRVNDPEKSAIVVIMQRLHAEDVTGVALSKDLGYEHLMIPMRFDPSRRCVTMLGRNQDGEEIYWGDPRKEEGELMFPERFPQAVVDRDEAALGKWATAAQFQQAPVPRGGGIIKRDWWQLWDDPQDGADPDWLRMMNLRFPSSLFNRKKYPPFDFIVASVDGAFTKDQENDPSALTVWGVFKDAYDLPCVMLIWSWAKYLELNELVQQVARDCRKLGVERLLIEAKASGIPLAQELERLFSDDRWGIELVNPKGDKTARVYEVEPLFSGGVVFAPDRQWAEDTKDEFEVFPRGAHDDRVDASTMALRWLRNAGMLQHGHDTAEDVGGYVSGQPTPLYPV